MGASADPAADTDQRVLLALREARRRLEAAERAAHEPIALIGIGCRFPGGARGADGFWRLLRDGVDAVGPIPAQRYDAEAWFDPTPGHPGTIYTRDGAFLDDVDRFDAAFFGISPREAVSLDPQQRLVLETAWEALEDAGQAPDGLRGSRSGVFLGLGRSDYALRLLRGPARTLTAWHATGNGVCYGPGRLAHVLDLKGPNLAVDTACSSSLVAVHLAAQSLRRRECDLALAGGCHVHLSPQVAVMLSMSRALAPDGRCKTFDAAADGFGQGEGCGIIVLRRLSDAIACGDPIAAVIRGSAINHDGQSGGLTVPSQDAQEAVIRDALADARVEPDAIDFVEAHGTGTPLGDPIELDALEAVLGRRPRGQPLLVGSVKTNIGHAEAAAGIAGLIKVVLALRHAEIPPHLHLRAPNPRVPWGERAIRVPTRATAWPPGSRVRMAGVSSFGMSGANAHVILEEAPVHEPAASSSERLPYLVTLSARSEPALRMQARRLAACLSEADAPPLADVSMTANAGRAHHPVRLGLVALSSDELLRDLSAAAAGDGEPGVAAENDVDAPAVAFLFSGQGSQFPGMGRELHDAEPAFRDVLARADAVLRPLWRVSLTDLLFAGDGTQLRQTMYTQPALFALSVALAAVWRSWGVAPRAVLGHSVGEYAAACVAGVFGFEDGLRLVAERARLMQALPQGAMAAALASEDQVRGAIGVCGHDVDVAAVNGAASVVISGPSESVGRVSARLRQAGVAVRDLPVSHAFHSSVMDPILRPLAEAAGRIAVEAPRIPLVSNVTGGLHADAPTGDDWARHAREPVRFAAGLDTLARQGCRAFVEIGPGGSLLGMAGRQLGGRASALLPSLMAGEGRGPMVRSLTRLYELGARIDWVRYHRGGPGRRTRLPTYPFEGLSFWPDEQPEELSPAPRLATGVRAYGLTWHRQALDGARDRTDPGGWLILADQGGLGESLAESLRERGDDAVLVDAGSTLVRTGPRRWTANPEEPSELRRLLAEMPEAPRLTRIVYLWACDRAIGQGGARDDVPDAQARACTGLLHLVQAVSASEVSAARIWVVTRNALEDGRASQHPPDLAQGGLWGLCRSLALERPELWGGTIDLSTDPTSEEREALLRELALPGAEDAIRLRGRCRLVARVEALTQPSARLAPLRADATYLVTGGTGALGLHVARWLVDRGAGSLVLMSRRPPTSAALEAIEALRSIGADVRAVRADVTRTAELEQVLAEIDAGPRSLRGVVHAAGAFGQRPIDDLDAETMRSVLRAKVEGGWLLHRLTTARHLDLFVLFSSLAALWGSKGQAHYAAANGFLDTLAGHRRCLGLPALSVAWGPWATDGMATAEARDRLRRIGVLPLRPEDALAALEQHLGGGRAAVALADIAWPEFGPVYQAQRHRPLLDWLSRSGEAPAAAAPLSFGHRLQGLASTERRDRLVSYLRRELAGVLGLDETRLPDMQMGFFRLGLDSMMAVELMSRLSREFGMLLSPTLVFDHPTIADLAEYLSAHLNDGDSGRTLSPDRAVDEVRLPEIAAMDTRPIAEKVARLRALVREV